MSRDLRHACLRILESGDLECKLEPPRGPDGSLIEPGDTGPALHFERPARAAGLRMHGGAEKLPPPRALSDPRARASCLARFAHHELMAVELFAWALLRWPDLPAAMQRDLIGALAEEQIHCRLYLARLSAHDGDFMTDGHSDYFWRQVPHIHASPQGPRAFLAGMGLTLEQANLDFSLIYRDGFREAGDEASARVCQRIHDDEIRHVAIAARWLEELSPERPADPVAAYEAAVPFPLAANRAKGRRFDERGRREAGLSDAFIEHVRGARSSQERAGRRRATRDAEFLRE